MSFIQRELDRITSKLQAGPLPAEEHGKLYAIQQALAWALEPIGFKSPYDMVLTGTPEGSEDCPEENGRFPFSNNPVHHAV
jgi:hypothetical protein